MRRGRDVVLIVAAVAGVILVLVALAGFDYVDGLRSVRAEYAASVARERPYVPFLAVNLAAFGVLVGPAALGALTRLRGSALTSVVAIGATMLLVALVSGMSKGEVERIWLPFALWVGVAPGVFRSRAGVACALATQVAVAVGVQFVVRSW
jgi:hypothetical protein